MSNVFVSIPPNSFVFKSKISVSNEMFGLCVEEIDRRLYFHGVGKGGYIWIFAAISSHSWYLLR